MEKLRKILVIDKSCKDNWKLYFFKLFLLFAVFNDLNLIFVFKDHKLYATIQFLCALAIIIYIPLYFSIKSQKYLTLMSLISIFLSWILVVIGTIFELHNDSMALFYIIYPLIVSTLVLVPLKISFIPFFFYFITLVLLYLQSIKFIELSFLNVSSQFSTYIGVQLTTFLFTYLFTILLIVLKSINDELLRKSDKYLEQLNYSKKVLNFIYGISHEINNPLFIAKGNLNLLEKDHQAEKAFHNIKISHARIQDLVSKLGTLTQLSESDLIKINLKVLIDDILDDLSLTKRVQNLVKDNFELVTNKSQISLLIKEITLNAIESVTELDGRDPIISWHVEGEHIYCIDNGKASEIDFSDKNILLPFNLENLENTSRNLGLFICDTICRVNNYEFKYEREHQTNKFIFNISENKKA